MVKILVTYDEKKCIGAASCEVNAPGVFMVKESGKSELIGAAKNPQTGLWEKEMDADEEQLKRLIAAGEGCPKLIIHVVNKETGQKLI